MTYSPPITYNFDGSSSFCSFTKIFMNAQNTYTFYSIKTTLNLIHIISFKYFYKFCKPQYGEIVSVLEKPISENF